MVPLLMSLFLLLLFILPVIVFFVPPPKHRPDGPWYWLALSLLILFCFLLLVAGFMELKHWNPDKAAKWIFAFFALPCVAILGLLANTFWARGVARKLPEGMDEEERREAMRRLSRRLSWPLLLLSFVVFLGVLLPQIGARSRGAIPVPVTPRPLPSAAPIPPAP